MAIESPKLLFFTLAAVFVTAASFLMAHFLEIGLIYAYFASVNGTTFLAYGSDKYRAVRHRFRIPEMVLHLLALAGGSPAALLAQTAFRHKTQKRSFKIIFVAIVFIQLAAVAGVLFLKYARPVSG